MWVLTFEPFSLDTIDDNANNALYCFGQGLRGENEQIDRYKQFFFVRKLHVCIDKSAYTWSHSIEITL